jgi:hypothetical protein
VVRVRSAAWAVGLGLLTFALRVLSSADLSNDHYMHMAWAQQILLGQVPGRDFVDPGMPLAYVLSALAQLVRPGPLTELLLASALLGLATSVTYLAAVRLSGSHVVAVAVTLLEVALQPRLYGYPKILVPVVVVALLQAYLHRPTLWRLAALGGWTGVAALFRHDLAVYAVAGAATGLVVLHAPDWRRAVRTVAIYAGAATVTMLPYLTFVQWAEGVVEHLRRGIEFSKNETHGLFFVPPLPRGNVLGWDSDQAGAFLYYLSYAIAPIAMALVWAEWTRQKRERLSAASASIALLAAYLVAVLRYSIDARLPDLAGVLALALAWVVGTLWQRLVGAMPVHRWRQAATAAVAAAVLLVVVESVWVFARVPQAIDNTGVYAGWRGITETWADLESRGVTWPWARSFPSRDLPPAIEYLHACTEPSDAVLLTWSATPYYFFAQRMFAAGHALFLPPRAYTSERDQAQMLSWLRAQRVPVALVNESRREEFVTAYPRVDEYIRANYADAGRFSIYDGSDITVAVRRDLRATGSWGPDAWPCHF